MNTKTHGETIKQNKGGMLKLTKNTKIDRGTLGQTKGTLRQSEKR
jgi:hypothetical protein